ncbi:hypothetical protein B9Z19DRAFT_1133161 [Tuber borchii]|uniref:NB-ARC domain-containing protein n=1 Tax=Tuber borchii TaxID=42251 RepID=A0A2T6ZGB4_TUBBO|nr:hypothetical protein B9Z19DRAFT_1133161 [Tuber borchii]
MSTKEILKDSVWPNKTQIALEYVHQRASDHNCDIFWIQGSGVSKFSEGFRAIARHVRIPLCSTEADEARLLKVKRWFEGPGSGTWILVIDNADNEADFAANDSPIAKFIPQANSGTLIFTTRSRQVASSQCSTATIEVGKMGGKEARKLFKKRFDGWKNLEDKEKEDVVAILNSVYHLPLAVENEERAKDLLSRRFYDIQREASHESILSTYFATFAQIRQQMPLAANLLRLMAFFNHRNIPEELLTQYGLEGMDHSADFRSAIGKLLGFSLVTMVRCGCRDKVFYDLNRLVQLSLQKYLPTSEMNQGRRAALKVISRLFPRSQDEQQYISPAYIPHALAATENSTDPTAEELGVRVALYLQDMSSYYHAETQFHRCTTPRQERRE